MTLISEHIQDIASECKSYDSLFRKLGTKQNIGSIIQNAHIFLFLMLHCIPEAAYEDQITVIFHHVNFDTGKQTLENYLGFCHILILQEQVFFHLSLFFVIKIQWNY